MTKENDSNQSTSKSKNPKIYRTDKWYSKAIRVVGKSLMKLFWPTKIYFQDNAIIDKKAIFICNHYSVFDSNPIISRIFPPKANVLFKADICEVMNFLIQQVGGIPINRDASDISAVKKVLNVLNNDEQILIFPEGSVNPHDVKQLLPFKEGVSSFAIKTHCAIVPMMYYRKPKLFRRNKLMVGEPFYLEEFYGTKSPEERKRATDYIYYKMLQLRHDLDYFVEELNCDEEQFKIYLENKGEVCK